MSKNEEDRAARIIQSFYRRRVKKEYVRHKSLKSLIRRATKDLEIL
jgi:hypothetical protein